MNINRRIRALSADLYIMKAFHLYDGSAYVNLQYMIDDSSARGHERFILFGRRDVGKAYEAKDWPTVAASSYGSGAERFEVGKQIRYTLDTGNGHRFVNYSFQVTGWLKINADGSLGERAGEVPGLKDRVNAYVFK